MMDTGSILAPIMWATLFFGSYIVVFSVGQLSGFLMCQYAMNRYKDKNAGS